MASPSEYRAEAGRLAEEHAAGSTRYRGYSKGELSSPEPLVCYVSVVRTRHLIVALKILRKLGPVSKTVFHSLI